MREIDRIAIEELGISGVVLMENAGRGATDSIRNLHQEIGGGMVGVLCGKGNNGGDGFVVARYLHSWDIPVACILLGERDEVQGDAGAQLKLADALAIPIVEWLGDSEGALAILDSSVIFVDALFGTGLNSDIREPAKGLIEAVNESKLPVVALDLPSGISADTGAVLGTAIQADITVTFGLPKRGIMVHPGCDYAGAITVVDIGIPSAVLEQVKPSAWTSRGGDGPLLGLRSADSHKGDYGRVLIVGGEPGKGGAPLLAGMGALRAGAGLVTVATDARCQPALEGRFLELMVESGWDQNGPKELLAELRQGMDALVLGPGLSSGADGKAIVQAMLAGEGPPVVLDASALIFVAEHPELVASASMPVVLTPHPGEAASLLGCSTEEVQANRFEALEKLVSQCGQVVVLKGARTLVSAPGAEVFINSTGNAGMATAGSGDVLAGVIGAFVARGISPYQAAILGVVAHGEAGDRIAATMGQDGLIASDLLDALPAVIAGHEAEPTLD
jgi:NAD(P)H-hydrate epimerase